MEKQKGCSGFLYQERVLKDVIVRRVKTWGGPMDMADTFSRMSWLDKLNAHSDQTPYIIGKYTDYPIVGTTDVLQKRRTPFHSWRSEIIESSEE